jgi:hypothetical protein
VHCIPENDGQSFDIISRRAHRGHRDILNNG